MKKLMMMMGICTLMMASCQTGKQGADDISKTLVKYESKDSNAFANTAVRITLIDSKDSVAQAINDTLWTVLSRDVESVNECVQKPAPLSLGKAQPLTSEGVTAYERWLTQQLTAESKELHKDRQSSEPADEATGKAAEVEPIQLYWQVKIDTLCSQPEGQLIAFHSQVATYLGGAHGTVGGEGVMLFNRTTGKKFTNFFKPGSEKALQPLLLSGLAEYFAQEDSTVTEKTVGQMLNIDVKDVTLPADTPLPTADGLTFCYGQYEVAAYAAGMPSFNVPYAKLLPYLTDEAKAVLGLEK